MDFKSEPDISLAEDNTEVKTKNRKEETSEEYSSKTNQAEQKPELEIES